MCFYSNAETAFDISYGGKNVWDKGIILVECCNFVCSDL